MSHKHRSSSSSLILTRFHPNENKAQETVEILYKALDSVSSAINALLFVYIMVKFTQVSGYGKLGMVLVLTIGQMETCMRDNGKIIKNMGMESFVLLKVTSMKVCGRTTSKMDRGFLPKIMETSTKETGKMIYVMDTAY